MNINDDSNFDSPNPSPALLSEIPVAQLVVEIYETAPPQVKSDMLSQLVGEVYETAPPLVRIRMLETLVRPLGVLTLATLANGIFAKFGLQQEGSFLPVQIEASMNVRPGEVVALVDRAQAVSMDAIFGLSEILSASPTLMASAVAAVLFTVLVRQKRNYRFE